MFLRACEECKETYACQGTMGVINCELCNNRNLCHMKFYDYPVIHDGTCVRCQVKINKRQIGKAGKECRS